MENDQCYNELNNSVSSLTQTFDDLPVICLKKMFDGSIPRDFTSRRRTKSEEWSSSSDSRRQCLRKNVSFINRSTTTLKAGGDEQTLASTQICTDDERDSIGSFMAGAASHSSLNGTKTTSPTTTATMEAAAKIGLRNSVENAPDSVVTETPQQKQNDKDLLEVAPPKAGTNDSKTITSPQQQVHKVEENNDDDEDDNDDDSFSFSFDRIHPALEVVDQEKNNFVDCGGGGCYDSVVTETSQQKQNDKDLIEIAPPKAETNDSETTTSPQQQDRNVGENNDDDDDDSDDDSFSFSFDRVGPALEVVNQEKIDVVDVAGGDDDDDDDDGLHSYLHHSFHSRGGRPSHHESKHSLSMDRFEEASETNTHASEQSLSLYKAVYDDEPNNSSSIHQLSGKNDHKDDNNELSDDSEGSFDNTELADKVNPLLHESVFQWSVSSLRNFPADVNEWNLVKILGEGNFGQVWQVDRKDLDDDRSYALKMLSKYQIVCDGEVDCVIAEKRMLLLVNEHPFVTKLRAAWQDDNLIYFLQDFLQGGELFSRMLDKEKQELNQSQTSVLPPRKAMRESHVQFYTACIADALHYMHSKRICYRDLKPENALLDELGYPVLIDLGAAKLLPPDCDRTFTMTGTPRYVAPELVNGSGHSFGVDHWALAVLAYEMLTGEHPFDYWDMEDEMLLFEAIAEADYKPLSPDFAIGDHAKDWIDQLLVKDPSQRLGSSVANVNTNDSPKKKSDLLTHPWLEGLRMTQLRHRSVPAPWKPRIINHHDSSFFDDWDHLDPVVQTSYPALTAREAAKFAPFDAVE